jgi:hypothetical protein
MARPPQTEITFPNVKPADVGQLVKDQITLGKATKVDAKKSGANWTVIITRPSTGGN